MRRNVKQNIRLLEIQSILTSAIFVIPVIVPYYRDVIGITFRDFLIGEAAFAFVVLVLEVPSGWLSDIWKRKYVIALGTIFDLLGFTILLFAENLFMAILAQSIIGVAISLFSGTNTAILYDSLIESGEEKSFGALEGRRNGFGLYAIGIASVIGGFIYAIHPQLPVYATILAQLLCLCSALLMVEPERHKSAVQGHPVADIASTMRYALHGHIEVAFILLFSAALFTGTKLNMWMQQPYYMELGVEEFWFGWLMAAGYLTGGGASHFSHKLFAGLNNLKALAIVWALAIFACTGAAFFVGYHGILMLMLGGSFIFGAANPRVREAINIRVGSERRATILSAASLLQQMAFIPLGVIIGTIVESRGIQCGLYGVSFWLALSGILLCLWAAFRNKKRPHKDLR
jgi:MFS family permease